MNVGNEFTLKLSETVVVRPGTFRAQISIVYAGMVNESTYSIAVIWLHANQGLSYNLFFPKTQRELEVQKGKLEIVSINKNELRFRYVP